MQLNKDTGKMYALLLSARESGDYAPTEVFEIDFGKVWLDA